MEDTDGSKVKLFIPAATPILPMDQMYDNRDLYVNTNNIVSDKPQYGFLHVLNLTI